MTHHSWILFNIFSYKTITPRRFVFYTIHIQISPIDLPKSFTILFLIQDPFKEQSLHFAVMSIGSLEYLHFSKCFVKGIPKPEAPPPIFISLSQELTQRTRGWVRRCLPQDCRSGGRTLRTVLAAATPSSMRWSFPGNSFAIPAWNKLSDHAHAIQTSGRCSCVGFDVPQITPIHELFLTSPWVLSGLWLCDYVKNRDMGAL